jgi:hypothetical protein
MNKHFALCSNLCAYVCIKFHPSSAERKAAKRKKVFASKVMTSELNAMRIPGDEVKINSHQAGAIILNLMRARNLVEGEDARKSSAKVCAHFFA